MLTQEELQKKIVTDLDIAHLPQEKQQEVIVQLGQNILRRVLLAITDSLSDDKLEEFDRLTAEGNVDEIEKFISANVPDAPQLIEKQTEAEITDFKKSTV